MTHFLQDILRQPEELQQSLDFLCGSGAPMLLQASNVIRNARHIYLTGMGASWHAAVNARAILHPRGFAAHTMDAADLLESRLFPPHSVVVIISRSGRSVELSPLIEMANESLATVIGITNNGDSPLAQQSHISLVLPVKPDHGISVNTYSTLALAAGVLATTVTGSFDKATQSALSDVLSQTGGLLAKWQTQIDASAWLAPQQTYYFLARRASFGSALEARLMWEEGVKAPATAMGTGSFRHGPQEIVNPNVRFCLWLDRQWMREQDLAIVRDLKFLGAHTMLIGNNVPDDLAALTIQLPEMPDQWDFLLDVMPTQLAAERLSRLAGVDCDTFRFSSFIVEDDYGLLKS
jgi:glucosamine--fructose-6-phosphate aminotransferase (isomerizing)